MKCIAINLLILSILVLLFCGCNGGSSSSNSVDDSANINTSSATSPPTLSVNPVIITSCSENQYYDSSKKTCVLKCTSPEWYDYEQKKCISNSVDTTCTGDLVFDLKYNACTCPNNMIYAFGKDDTCTCEIWQDLDKEQKKCVPKKCKEGYEINDHYPNLGCIQKCESGTIFDLDLKKCRKECTNNTYWILEKRECVQSRPLKSFKEDDHEPIPKLTIKNNKTPKVCLALYSEVAQSKEKIATIINSIKKAIDVWLEPLRNFAINNNFFDDVEVVIKEHCNDDYPLPNQLFKVNVGNWGMTSVGGEELSLDTKEFDNFKAYVHEMGHLMGFNDHYYYPDTQPANVHVPCHPGYDESITVMGVLSGNDLKAADVEGIKKRYCRYYPEDRACDIFTIKKSSDIDTGDFIICNPGDERDKFTIRNKYEYSEDYRPGIVNDRIKDHIEVIARGGDFLGELAPTQEDFSGFIWKYSDEKNKANNITLDFINNNVSLDLVDVKEIHRNYNKPIYEITDDGTKIKFICKVPNTFLRYQIIKKLKEKYTNLTWEPAY
ncbi:MAG: hypothetical protein HQK51_01715 [Oligoflexia bacterium]|nr:hypothetical protein [Oligoflexia bacterium]